MFTDLDRHLFHEGRHTRLYERLGARPHVVDNVPGTWFAVWAPGARRVAWIGDDNAWDPRRTPMHPIGSGVWGVFVPRVGTGARYKFHVVARNGETGDKADPFAAWSEDPPATASVVWTEAYAWRDEGWMQSRGERQSRRAPIAIYEVHLGSWRRRDGRPLGYREIAPRLVEHVRALGFTHVELMPVMEHPYYGSWGYQLTGFFAATRRYGTPSDLCFLIDELHQAGIGVILDWVPGHFPSDGHGLAWFDGTPLYERAEERMRWHPEWGSLQFDDDKPEVKSFLLSSARSWLDRYHADGLRVDGVASMLYLDYARREGEWTPNQHGGRENLGAVELLRRVNEMIRTDFADCLSFAEDSTSWPKVTAPVADGGLGFTYKWDMGWMHDTLQFLALDPIFRKDKHAKVTFRSLYQANEAWVLPLSHDEVVHGKRSLIEKMDGDDWKKRANLRLLFANQWSNPGKKLLFMGCEFGQRREWNHDVELDWTLLERPEHAGLSRFVAALNALYVREPALHAGDDVADGFEWIEGSDSEHGVVAWLRRAPGTDEVVAVVQNLTPVHRSDYWVGVPTGGRWTELLNSDDVAFGGSGVGNPGGVLTDDVEVHRRPFRIRLELPPLGALFLKNTEPQKRRRRKKK